MSRYLQGDIVFVPFPFTDLSTTKRRPMFIISNNAINNNRGALNCVGLMITRHIRDGTYDVVIDPADARGGALRFRSEIKCDNIATIEKELVIRKFCSLKAVKMRQVKSVLAQVVR